MYSIDPAMLLITAIDKPLLILFLALCTTIGLFLMDVFPYPFGVIVLALFMLLRISHVMDRRRKNDSSSD